MTLEQNKERLDNLKSRVGACEEKISDFEHYVVNRGTELAINVKRHNDFVDLDELIKAYEFKIGDKLTDEAIEKLKEELDLDRIWSLWLSTEREYVTEGLFKGVNLSKPQYYERLKRDVLDGKKTDYPAIDGLSFISDKLETLKLWKHETEQAWENLSLISKFGPSWAGRQSGYFVLLGAFRELDEFDDDIRERLTQAEEAYETLAKGPSTSPDTDRSYDEAQSYFDVQCAEAEAMLSDHEPLTDAVVWAYKMVEGFNNALDFSAEIMQRIPEELDFMAKEGVITTQEQADEIALQEAEAAKRQYSIFSSQERELWDCDVQRLNDQDGDVRSLVIVVKGVELEISIERAEHFGLMLKEKVKQCIWADEKRENQS